MPQDPLDPIVPQLFSNIASSVAGDIIPKVQQFRNFFVALPPPHSDQGSCEHGSVRRYTDSVWYADVKNGTDFPTIVSTTSCTQSSSFKELQKKCAEFISHSEIHVDAVVAMKVQLDRKDSRSNVLGNSVERPLCECRMSLHVWAVENAELTHGLQSTPDTMPDESISRHPWHFAKYIVGERPDYIRIHSSDVEEVLKIAIQTANRVPTL